MASLAATNWHKPVSLVPILSWSTASSVFTEVSIVQWLGVELCKLSLQASKIHFCIHKMWQNIPGYWHIVDFEKNFWPLPKPFWIAIKIYISLHLRYLDKIWFANRLWPSEGSDINRYETGSIIQPSWPPSWEMDMTSYFRSGCFDFEKKNR